MALAQAVLRDIPTEILRVPDGEEWSLASVTICNTTSEPETVIIHAVPPGTEVDDSTTILHDVILERHATFCWEHALVLSAGERLVGVGCFGGRTTITVSFRRS